jgi:hypothetical protein
LIRPPQLIIRFYFWLLSWRALNLSFSTVWLCRVVYTLRFSKFPVNTVEVFSTQKNIIVNETKIIFYTLFLLKNNILYSSSLENAASSRTFREPIWWLFHEIWSVKKRTKTNWTNFIRSGGKGMSMYSIILRTIIVNSTVY